MNNNMKEFRKLVKSLPAGQRARLPEKIRQICNRTEHTDLLKAIALGAYLDMTDEITLLGYVTDLPEDISPDRQYCTTIRDNTTDVMIIGEDDAIHSKTITLENIGKKVLYA